MDNLEFHLHEKTSSAANLRAANSTELFIIEISVELFLHFPYIVYFQFCHNDEIMNEWMEHVKKEKTNKYWIEIWILSNETDEPLDRIQNWSL